MATRLASAVLLVSLASLSVATIVGVRSGFDLGRRIYEDRLGSLAGAGAFDIAAQLAATSGSTDAIALSPGTAVAIEAFGAGRAALADDVAFDARRAIDDLTSAYERTYISVGTDGSVAISEIVDDDLASLYLQSEYSIETVDADSGELVAGVPTENQSIEIRTVDRPGGLDDAGDGSEWTATHALYHPSYRRAVDELELIDLYLVDAADSRVVYSVAKRPDLGTSLVTGPFGGSVLADTVNQVIKDPSGGTVVSDLSFYTGAPGLTVGVIASPVFDGNELVGVVASMYDGQKLTDILTASELSTLDESEEPVEVYVIGADGTLRTNPLSYLAAPTAFLDESEASGLLSPSQRAEIDKRGTAVLTQPAVRSTVLASQGDDTAVTRRTSMTGGTVYSTVSALPIDAPRWYITSEASVEDSETSLGAFRSILIVGASIFVIAIAFLAVAWANRIMRPVRTISERLGAIDDNHEPLVIPDQSPVEMHHLVASFDSMAATLDHQQLQLALAREQRLTLLRQMLPAQVADRLANGTAEGLEQVPHASVVVVVVRGLGELVRSGGMNRDLVERLHVELDGLAEQHGVDRIKVVGDAYFAACGHDRPFIDHAPRVVTFATDARDAIRALGDASNARLDVSVGVATGSVRVGMTGGARLVYDVWGETVSTAHLLARSAGAGDILLSDSTHALLPDEIASDSTDLDGDAVWKVADSAMGSLG